MKKDNHPAEVNTSYTSFFVVATISLSFLLSRSLGEFSNISWAVILVYGLLLYFVWDLIKQLYSPGQAVFLYAITFIILPFAMNMLLNFPYGRLGTVVILGSWLLAGIAELIYEAIVKKRLPKKLLKRMLLIDNEVDKSMVKISSKHLSLSEYKGMAAALILVFSYFALTYLLLHR